MPPDRPPLATGRELLQLALLVSTLIVFVLVVLVRPWTAAPHAPIGLGQGFGLCLAGTAALLGITYALGLRTEPVLERLLRMIVCFAAVVLSSIGTDPPAVLADLAILFATFAAYLEALFGHALQGAPDEHTPPSRLHLRRKAHAERRATRHF